MATKSQCKLEIEELLQPPSREHYSLCRCGASKNKPYCDGSHHDAGFTDEKN
ncbi:MAG: CDGSH iron-sulfur domain-containing protein [bacterium]